MVWSITIRVPKGRRAWSLSVLIETCSASEETDDVVSQKDKAGWRSRKKVSAPVYLGGSEEWQLFITCSEARGPRLQCGNS